MMISSSLISCAVSAARAAGAHALQNQHRRGEVIASFKHDVKLKLDVECQQIIEDIVLKTFPQHAFLGEESSKHETIDNEYVWVADPIDGTVNFTHGFPYWCTSIAVQRNGETVAGAVYAPALQELYTAEKDKEAFCNDTPVRVSKTAGLKQSMVMTGMDRDNEPGHEPYSIFRAIADNTQKARITGSAALDICQVAAGRADGYFESCIYLWDIAAAGLIAQQAGGQTEIIHYPSDNIYRMRFIASNGIIHNELRALIKAHLHN